MLEKNKDYVEFTLQYTSVDWSRHSVRPEVSLNGYSDFDFPGVPIMDVVCKEFDHKVVVVGKREFEKMQADVNINAELAKQWEINYDLLLKKIGFDTVEELVNYLNSEAECNTLREAIASLEYSVKFARDERRDLSKKLDECEKDYVSERDKAEALQTENKQLKKKVHEYDPMPESKDLLKQLYSKEDVEKLEWTLNHICGGQASVNGWMVSSKLWRRNYEALSKLVGFSSVEEIQDYLTNEAECDTLQEAISKLKDQVKYTCDEWYSANSRNNSWKAAAECNTPKELIEKLNLLRDDISGRSTVIEHYKRDIEKWQKATGCISPKDISTSSLITKATQLDQEVKILNGALQEWKENTGCLSPLAAKTLIESGMSYEYAYHKETKENRKLTEEVDSWKNVTGYSTPEDFLAAKINDLGNDYLSWKMVTGCSCPKDLSKKIVEWEKALTPHMSARDLCSAMSNVIESHKSSIEKWQDATGCNAPEVAKCRINALINEATTWESDYNHLLALTGFDNEGEIEDFLEQNNDRNKLTTVIDNLKLENEAMKTALRTSNLAMQKELDQEINEWQKATGRIDPEAAKQYIDRLKGRLNKIHGYSVDC